LLLIPGEKAQRGSPIALDCPICPVSLQVKGPTLKQVQRHLIGGHGLLLFLLRFFPSIGVELMPCIRNWKGLKFYRPSKDIPYDHIDSLFGDNVVDWDLIGTHWQDLLRVVISIQEGKELPSMLLCKLTGIKAIQSAVHLE
jgi:TnpA family transposase